MCSIDLEPCTVWRNTPRVARKQHECGACGGPIHVGAHYLDHFDVFEGEPTTTRACFGCWAAWLEFYEAHGTAMEPGRLIEMLRECVGENDDEEDEWRPLLADVLRRYRVSPARRETRRLLREARP